MRHGDVHLGIRADGEDIAIDVVEDGEVVVTIDLDTKAAWSLRDALVEGIKDAKKNQMRRITGARN